MENQIREIDFYKTTWTQITPNKIICLTDRIKIV